ncbi:hypothetical protein C8J56DRAFT_1060185 [Mycena floridula]|nr:hypothetical protein C8J56DRAFT_1060185 [Mycena floridula]
MAVHGKNTGSTVQEVISSYRVAGTTMLGRTKGSDSQNSISISIRASLDSPLVKDELNARVLLSIIARLPLGATRETLQNWWVPRMKNLDGALRALLEGSLLEHQNSTYLVLPVIRSHLLATSRLSPSLHDSMVTAASSFLEKHDCTSPGKPSYKDDMQARANEEINLQAILLNVTESNPDVIKALLTLAWHQYRLGPRTEVIEHAVKLAHTADDQKLLGHSLRCYSAILHSLNRLDEALEQCTLSRKAYIAASKPTSAALRLLGIADLSSTIDLSFDEIALVEQARRELESVDGRKDRHMNKDLLFCTIRLAKAQYREGDYTEAIEHLKHVRDSCKESPFNAADCAQYLCQAYHRLGELDEAEKWAVTAVNEWKQMDAYPGFSLLLLGRIYISQDKYEPALASVTESLDFAKGRAEKRHTAEVLVALGRVHLMQKGNPEKAKTLITDALLLYGNLEAVEAEEIVCRFYLDKLKDSSRVPTKEEADAFEATGDE